MGWELQLPTGDVFKVTGKATIGRALNNQIVLNDTLVSRVHVELYCQGAALIVNDLHSRNGTYVNEVLVSPALPRSVQPGDLLRVGSTNIYMRHTGDDTLPGEAIRRPLLPKPAQVLYVSEPRNLIVEFIEILKGEQSKEGT